MAVRKKTKKKVGSHRKAMLMICVVSVMMMGVLMIGGNNLKKKQIVYAAKEAQLQSEIDDENNRTAEIEKDKKYRQTKAYVEEIARDKLGMVYPNEIIYKAK